MSRKTIKIGIMSQKAFRARTLAIAKGQFKPKRNEPKIWFTSLNSLAKVFSDENLALLQVMAAKKPRSLRELAAITGNQPSKLTSTLKTLSAYGFVKLKKNNNTVYPIANATNFNVTFGIQQENSMATRLHTTSKKR